MATRHIPAQAIMTCDCCGKEMKQSDYRMAGHLKLRRHGLDYQGSAVGDASTTMDLCDPCVMQVEAAITRLTLTLTPEGGGK